MVNEKSEWLMIYVPTIHQSTVPEKSPRDLKMILTDTQYPQGYPNWPKPIFSRKRPISKFSTEWPISSFSKMTIFVPQLMSFFQQMINFEGFYSKNEQFRFSLKMTQFLVFHQRAWSGLFYPGSKDRVEKFGLIICVFQSVRVKISQNLCFGFSYFENLSQVNMTFENVFSFVFWIFC